MNNPTTPLTLPNKTKGINQNSDNHLYYSDALILGQPGELGYHNNNDNNALFKLNSKNFSKKRAPMKNFTSFRLKKYIFSSRY